jgi:hypothetical protein
MTSAIRRIVAQHTGIDPRVGAFPWWLVLLASPFVTTFREMREMGYLWRTPVQMKNTRLIATLGREPHTPLDLAVEATLVGMGSMAVNERDGASTRALARFRKAFIRSDERLVGSWRGR